VHGGVQFCSFKAELKVEHITSVYILLARTQVQATLSFEADWKMQSLAGRPEAQRHPCIRTARALGPTV